MKKHNVKRIMAYIYMPLFYIILGFGIVYIAARPFIDTVSSYIGIFISNSEPVFMEELGSIFEAPGEDTVDVDTVPASEVEIPSIGIMYATISCDRIGLKADIYYGDNDKILKKGVGQYAGSFMPGFGQPIMLAAHNTTFFLPLEKAQIGDVIVITTSYGIYNYEITDMQVRSRSDSTAYDLGKMEEELIMYTCYPFNMLGSLKDRYFVYAKKISGPVIDFE